MICTGKMSRASFGIRKASIAIAEAGGSISPSFFMMK